MIISTFKKGIQKGFLQDQLFITQFIVNNTQIY